MRRLEFTIAVKPFGEAAKKDASKFTGELRAQDASALKLGKTLTKTISDAHRELTRTSGAVRQHTNFLVTGFGAATSAVDKFNQKLIHGTKHAFEKVRESFREAWPFAKGNLLAHGIEKLFDAPKKIIEVGSADIKARQRLGREFGGDAEFMERIAKRVGSGAGLDNASALQALFQIGESVSSTTKGTNLRGKKLSEGDAKRVREQTFNFGAKLFERVSTITGAKGEEAEQLAYLLSNAGSGPEGMRGLVAGLHLNKAYSAEILKANEKGKLADLVGADKAKELGIKKGQIAGQGTVIDLLLQKSGFTEGAAAEERQRFGYQLKSIGATFENVLGDIGSRTLDKITGGFAKGETMAERFKKAIESPKGQETIKKIADGIAAAAEGAVKLATKLPDLINFLERHKTLIGAAAGVWGVATVAKPVAGLLGKAGGLLSGGISLVKGGVPVYVTNDGAGGAGGGGIGGLLGIGKKALGALAGGGVASGLTLAAAGAAAAYGGGKAGTYLGKHVAPVGKAHDKIADTLYLMTGEAVADKKLENFEVQRHRDMLMRMNAKRQSLIGDLESKGISHGRAVYLSEHKNEIADAIKEALKGTALHIDGKKVGEIVNGHNARQLQNATAGIRQ